MDLRLILSFRTMFAQRRSWLLCLVVVVLLLTCAVFAINYHHKRMYEVVAKYRYECPMHLLDLWSITVALAKEKDRFPQDLASINVKIPLVSQSRIRLRLSPVLCPGSEIPFDKNEFITNVSDYVYINWSSTFGHVAEVPGEYPLAYDRRLANHLGKGVYVVKVNGSVVWDADAQWIRQFSTKNPELHIPIPQ
jgi:hypothetical protein